MENAYRISAAKPEGKILLGKLKRKWEDNIKMDCKVIRRRICAGSGWVSVSVYLTKFFNY
jgi:hypothetical protein